MALAVSGVDHLYLAVRDLERSVAFWDPLTRLLGFRKGTKPIGGEPHVHYFNRLPRSPCGRATTPAFYAECAPDYYAAFFSDPDGLRIEIVAMRRYRALLRDHWHELTEFENPLQKAGLA